MFTCYINPINYINEYRSCGIIFSKKFEESNYFLFTIETRKESTNPVVHIIGGKRIDQEYPHETVCRETWEETGKLVSVTDCLNSVFDKNATKYWYKQGKYILYIANCPTQYNDIDQTFNYDSNNTNKLIWIKDSELVSNILNQKFEWVDANKQVYKYSDLMINSLLNFAVFC